MMNTTFSVGARLWYTSATVAKPSLSSVTSVTGAADEGVGVAEDTGDDIDGLDFCSAEEADSPFVDEVVS